MSKQKTTLLLVALCVASAIGIIVSKKLFVPKPAITDQAVSDVSNVTPTPTLIPPSDMDKSTPEEVVRLYIDNLLLASPPQFERQALTDALSLLSEGASMNIDPQKPRPGDLAAFVGIQDIPDQGYELGEVVYKDNAASNIPNGLAEVPVTLMYSGGDTVKVFQLSKVGEYWQIDGVLQ